MEAPAGGGSIYFHLQQQAQHHQNQQQNLLQHHLHDQPIQNQQIQHNNHVHHLQLPPEQMQMPPTPVAAMGSMMLRMMMMADGEVRENQNEGSAAGHRVLGDGECGRNGLNTVTHEEEEEDEEEEEEEEEDDYGDPDEDEDGGEEEEVVNEAQNSSGMIQQFEDRSGSHPDILLQQSMLPSSSHMPEDPQPQQQQGPFFSQALSLLSFASAAGTPLTPLLMPQSCVQNSSSVPRFATPSPMQTGNACVFGENDAEEERKREKEHKKRSKNWTRTEMLKLIRLRTDMEPRFAQGGKKMELWDEISETLRREGICRDAQQCRDKWEKLSAGYKEVRDGIKSKEDNPFYDELHPVLSGKLIKRERERQDEQPGRPFSDALPVDEPMKEEDGEDGQRATEKREESNIEEESNEHVARTISRKKRKTPKCPPVTDLAAVQSLLETVIWKQQRFFRDLLDSIERREQLKEQMRQEREERWRAEDRAQRSHFNNAIILLAQKLTGEKIPGVGDCSNSLATIGADMDNGQGPKKRSKNWKRTEVLQLIKMRGQMETKFATGTKRAAVWDELAEMLAAQGTKRDGKQCREKWDKLMAAYKDVMDGKRQQGDSPYFAELTAIMGHPMQVS